MRRGRALFPGGGDLGPPLRGPKLLTPPPGLVGALLAGAPGGAPPAPPGSPPPSKTRLFRATRPSNRSAGALSASRPYNSPPLAEVGVNITYNHAAILQPDPDDSSPELRIATTLDDGVLIVKLFPGIDARILRGILSVEGIRAVVLETYGAGNAPTSEWFIRLVEETIARGILVLNVTQCGGGRVAMELYETGLRLQKAGVLCGYDMTSEAAVTKLMYVLGKGLPPEQSRALLQQPLRGEFTR